MSKTVFFLLLAILGGVLQNQQKIKHWLNPAPPMDFSKQKVVLYSTKWCGYCAKTRDYFAENQIPYQDIDVELTEQGRADYAKFGAGGVPIVVINNDAVIMGYDPDRIGLELGID